MSVLTLEPREIIHRAPAVTVPEKTDPILFVFAAGVFRKHEHVTGWQRTIRAFNAARGKDRTVSALFCDGNPTEYKREANTGTHVGFSLTPRGLFGTVDALRFLSERRPEIAMVISGNRVSCPIKEVEAAMQDHVSLYLGGLPVACVIEWLNPEHCAQMRPMDLTALVRRCVNDGQPRHTI